jgi:hypothetical protein
MKTHTCSVNGEGIREYSFQVADDLPEFLCPWLTDWLSTYVEDGADFKDKQTLQFGFWMLRCRVQGQKMRLQAPELGSMPVKWVEDLTPAFNAMMVHKYIPESFDSQMDLPCMTDTATVGRLFDRFPMFMNRMDRVDNGVDSGWFLGSSTDGVDNNDPEQLTAMSLFEASAKAPWIHDFLSLPLNYQVVFDSRSPVVLRDFETAAPVPNSYFDSRYPGS